MKAREPVRPPPAPSRSTAQRAAHTHASHPAAATAQSTGAPFDEEPVQARRIAQLHACANRAESRLKRQ